MVIKILMMSPCIIDGCHGVTVGELNPLANLMKYFLDMAACISSMECIDS